MIKKNNSYYKKKSLFASKGFYIALSLCVVAAGVTVFSIVGTPDVDSDTKNKTSVMTTKEDDFVEHLMITSTHSDVLFFTNKGRVYKLRAYEIPDAGRQAKGTNLINLIAIEPDEKIQTVLTITDEKKEGFLFMATNRGTVKKTTLTDFDSTRKIGLNAITLDDGEDLIDVKLTDGHSSIILATRNGLAIHFSEDDVRPMGRTAHGVRGILLGVDDIVVSMDTVPENGEVLTATEEGMGKRTMISEYRVQTRGGKGVINLRVTEKTGHVVGAIVLLPQQEIIMVTAAGLIIRLTADGISKFGRNAQGVKLIDLNGADKVVAIAVVEEEDDEE